MQTDPTYERLCSLDSKRSNIVCDLDYGVEGMHLWQRHKHERIKLDAWPTLLVGVPWAVINMDSWRLSYLLFT